MFHFGARYEPEGSGVWVEGLITVADRQKHMGPADNSDTQRIPPKHGTPGYTSYAIRGGYRISKHLNTTAAVENITNHDYRSHGSGVNEPGTNVILGLDLQF
jgi:hemoglobin/transferrin/lactoferrin receptor protein